jgi:NADH-quinone oxidoreductase E subunit
MFSEDVNNELESLRSHYPVAKAAMMPVLHAVQRERGWIDGEARAWVAHFLDVTATEVDEVVTFYPMLYGTPQGRHVIHVCRTLSCDCTGAKDLWDHLESKLGVGRGEATADGRFSLRSAECLASCGTSPVVLLDGERHENMTPEKLDALLEAAS